MPTFKGYDLTRYKKYKANIFHTLGIPHKARYKDENPKTALKKG